MLILKALLSALVLPVSALAQEHITFPTEDGGVVSADVYGSGERGVVLAHGGRFTKESWQKQAEVLVHAGFRALAIDFRGRDAWASIEVRRRRVRARRIGCGPLSWCDRREDSSRRGRELWRRGCRQCLN